MYKILDDLKNIRLAKGMTQAQLAKQTNTPSTHLCKLETKGNPRLSTLVKILDVLGYEVRAVKK
jgi:transcriptional regulator with XRE-family HTH domain